MFGSWDGTRNGNPKHYSVHRWHEPVHLAVETMRTHGLWMDMEDQMVYGFGVAQGHTPSILRKSLPDVPFVGFDSFQGLPSEDDRKSKMSRWKKGDFNNTYTPEELENAAGGRPHVRLVSGFCDATLTSTLVAEMALRVAIAAPSKPKPAPVSGINRRFRGTARRTAIQLRPMVCL